ncbi:tumor necrosis factor ligand superfamily member 15 [Rhineura floridana]|uniref:tumor necrosis factor ligand superfamily member 15 n=1 Tax=Rhineura floridana TaxID=261503 RepID=UPI002AC80DD0|nr:tumor necrosis factor ligand superfamily member 15 [Rhineura floridana]
MDWASDFSLQGRPGEHPQRRRRDSLKGDLRRLRCLVLCCILVLLLFSVLLIYLLGRSLGCKQDGEMPIEKPPKFQRQRGYPESKPKIQVTVANKQNLSCAGDELPILKWEYARHTSDQMKHTDHFLIVPKNGDYFVYTQVTFRCPGPTCETIEYCGKKGVDEDHTMVVISVKKRAYSVSIPLMRSDSSIGEKTKWKKTIYVGGVVHLTEDDKLMVNVSNPALVGFSGNGDITYFGAFLI